MNERINMRLFLASGHLSPEAAMAYASGKLRKDLSILVDKHMESCDFCRQAIYGLILTESNETLTDQLTSIHMKVRIRAKERSIEHRNIPGAFQGSRWFKLSAAAVLLIGLVFAFYFINLQPLKLKLQLAGSYTEVNMDGATAELPSLPSPAFERMEIETSDLDEAYTHSENMLSPEETTHLYIVESDDLEEAETDREMAGIPDTKTQASKPLPPPVAINETTNDVSINAGQKDEKEISYIEGVAIATESTRLKQSKKQTNAIFTLVEEMPEFPGGTQGLHAYLEKNIQLSASDNLIGGKVIVSFEIDEKGRVRNPLIERGLESSINREILRAVKRMPNWTPGRQDGQAVRTRMTLPVDIHPSE